MNLRLTEKQLAVIKKKGGYKEKETSRLPRFGIGRCETNKNECLEGFDLILMEYPILKEYIKCF